jgi:PilZ domain
MNMPLTRRREIRQPADEPVLVEICDPSGTSLIVDAVIVDISRSGMRLSIPRSVDAGRQIKVFRNEPRMECLGTVRYCREATREDGCFVGIELAVPIEARDLPPYRVRETGLMTVFYHDGISCNRRRVSLVEVSRSSFVICTDYVLYPGAQILVSLDGIALFGTVRSLYETEERGYIANARISDVVNGRPNRNDPGLLSVLRPNAA